MRILRFGLLGVSFNYSIKAGGIAQAVRSRNPSARHGTGPWSRPWIILRNGIFVAPDSIPRANAFGEAVGVAAFDPT
jgi:hypothetical protein